MPRRGEVEAHHFEAMGTSCSLFGIDVTRATLLQAEFWVRRMAARFTRFSDRSELARLNSAEGWMGDRLAGRPGANMLANLGGDLRAAGSGPAGDGWPVGFGGVTVMLRDQGAATSSVRRRSWGHLHHLIDPRTGLPARSGLEEVAVVAASGCDAEIVAKTALLLGPGLAPAYCAAHAQAWWLGP